MTEGFGEWRPKNGNRKGGKTWMTGKNGNRKREGDKCRNWNMKQ
jgi:hypothetical protein